MKSEPCDILVVGAGPAGASAAGAAALRGAEVIVIERRAVIGVPVRCAEYIPAALVGRYRLEKTFIVQSLRGMRTILPDGETKETAAPGFTIHRDRFDQSLARAAMEQGAQFRLSTTAVSMENGSVTVTGPNGRIRQIQPRVIVGADGPHSRVGSWIGSVNRDMIPAAQTCVPLTETMDFTEIYFHPNIYGGYGWLFPKGRVANVGLGAKTRESDPRKLNRVLDAFLERLTDAGKIINTPSGRSGGWIPAEPLERVVRGNVILAGDAAGHTHPITGAGVFQAVVCGRMAGKWAARASEAGDPDLLNGYDREWRDLFQDTLARAWSRRRYMEKEWDHLDRIVKSCWVAFREYYDRT